MIKTDHGRESQSNCLPENLILSVERLMRDVKNIVKGENMRKLMIEFYETIVDVSEYLDWKPEYLKLAKFLSLLFYHP